MPVIDSEIVQAIFAIIAAIVILVLPRTLNWAVALFLILYGITGLIGAVTGGGG